MDGTDVLVTGGGGFVGRQLVARLLAAGRRVTIVDNFSVGLDQPAKAPGLAVVAVDIRDTAALTGAVQAAAPKAIIHLAALHHVPTCTAEPRRAIDINIVGTQTVLDAAAIAGVGRIVLASSGAVYDWLDAPLSETSPTRPHDTYAVCKLANEQQLEIWCRSTGGCGRVARLFNVIGPGDPNGHLIPDVLNRLAAAPAGLGPIALKLGNLDRRRDYIHVEDAAEGLIALLDDRDPRPFSIDNLCSGVELTVEALVEQLAAALGLSVACVSDPGLRRAHDRLSQCGDPQQMLARTGWRVRRPVASALAAIAAADGRFTVPQPR